jgi:hypothetical protein
MCDRIGAGVEGLVVKHHEHGYWLSPSSRAARISRAAAKSSEAGHARAGQVRSSTAFLAQIWFCQSG